MAQGKPDIARRTLAVARGASLEQVNCCIKAIKGAVDKGHVKIGDWPARTSLYTLVCSRHQVSPRSQDPIAIKLDENHAPHDEINALAECREC